MSSLLSVVFLSALVVIELIALLVLCSHASSRQDQRASLVVVSGTFLVIGAISLWLSPIRGSIYEESLDFTRWFTMGNLVILAGMIAWAFAAANIKTAECGTTPTSH